MPIYDKYTMLQDSFREMYFAAEYCINTKLKEDANLWPSGPGCYGFPCALLLLSIADAIGFYVFNTKQVRIHFDILKHRNYYNLPLSDKDIKIIYKQYRNLLIHNAAIANDTWLIVGNPNDPVFKIENNMPCLNLSSFLKKTDEVLKIFLPKINQIIK